MSNAQSNNRPAWDDKVLVALLTRQRLTSYLAAAHGNLPDALRLYEWNTKACGAVIQTVALTEVVVRNAMDAELTRWTSLQPGSRSWFDLVPLESRGVSDIAQARRRATRGGRDPEDHGKVIAELSLGFWRYLTTPRYHANLWVPALRRAFPLANNDFRRSRQQVEQALDRLAFVRNRAAHHEPIHRRVLARDLDAAISLCGWVHQDAANWATAISTLDAVMAAKPNV